MESLVTTVIFLSVQGACSITAKQRGIGCPIFDELLDALNVVLFDQMVVCIRR